MIAAAYLGNVKRSGQSLPRSWPTFRSATTPLFTPGSATGSPGSVLHCWQPRSLRSGGGRQPLQHRKSETKPVSEIHRRDYIRNLNRKQHNFRFFPLREPYVPVPTMVAGEVSILGIQQAELFRSNLSYFLCNGVFGAFGVGSIR